MNAGDAFHDTNVLLYLLSADERKADIAEALLAAGGIISVQVLDEFASVASRKLSMRWADIGTVLGAVRGACRVENITLETHERALVIAQRNRIGIYDATIVASAVIAGARVLYSEDFQAGRFFEGRIRIVNPFAQ